MATVSYAASTRVYLFTISIYRALACVRLVAVASIYNSVFISTKLIYLVLLIFASLERQDDKMGDYFLTLIYLEA